MEHNKEKGCKKSSSLLLTGRTQATFLKCGLKTSHQNVLCYSFRCDVFKPFLQTFIEHCTFESIRSRLVTSQWSQSDCKHAPKKFSVSTSSRTAKTYQSIDLKLYIDAINGQSSKFQFFHYYLPVADWLK